MILRLVNSVKSLSVLKFLRGSASDGNSEPAYFERRRFRRVKDEFLSLAAHEIRTPITVIKAQAQLAKRLHSSGRFEGEEIEKALAVFVQESDRLSRLCADLLDLARLDVGLLLLRKEFFDLNEAVSEVVSRFRSKTSLQSYDFEVQSKIENPVKGDRERTMQILTNLLTNAERYSPNGGKIEVKLGQAGGMVCLSVRDEGIGLESEDLSKVFDRFYQIRQQGLKGPTGIGVGLYLSKEFVQRMGGHIVARSKGLGKGAEFTFALPIGSVGG